MRPFYFEVFTRVEFSTHPTPVLHLFLLKRSLRNRTFKSIIMNLDQGLNLRVGWKIFGSMSSWIFAVQKNSYLEILFENIWEVSRSSKHNTVVSKIIDILPMKSSLDQQLHNIQMPFKRGPVKRIRSYLFGAAHHNSSELWFHFQILLSCLFRYEKLAQFSISETAGPDECIPLLFIVAFWIIQNVPSWLTSAFLLRHLSTS